MSSKSSAHKIFTSAPGGDNNPSAAELLTAISEWTKQFKRPLVFTNGCFDILHRGHIDYLQRAAELGDSLIVGINTDASVRHQDKGGERPINELAERAAVLAALACVDGVVAFDWDTPLKLIKCIAPQHLVKGGDWSINKIVGSEVVIKNGGQVHSLPIKFPRSTTDIINQIRDG